MNEKNPAVVYVDGMTDEQTEAALSRLDAPLREVASAFRKAFMTERN